MLVLASCIKLYPEPGSEALKKVPSQSNIANGGAFIVFFVGVGG